MLLEIVGGLVCFGIGAISANNSAMKTVNAAVSAQQKTDDFYTGFKVDRGLRVSYSLAWYHTMSLSHYASDIKTELTYRKSFQTPDEYEGAIEKAESFISHANECLEQFDEELADLIEEMGKDLTKDDYNVVGYFSEWKAKVRDQIAVIQHLINEG